MTNEIVLPVTGELVPLDEPAQVAAALHQVREWKTRLDEIRAVLEDALRIESERQGTKTLHLDGLKAVVTGGEKTEYHDPQALADELREEGMPEERVAQIVATKVSYTVNQAKAKHAAGANPRYAEVIERHRRVMPAPWRVTVEKGV
jgi:hypothetical protein